MKLIVFLLLVLGFAYRLALNLVQARSAENPIPENVADVYDAETYGKWRRYSAEKSRLQTVSTVLYFIVSLVLLFTNAYAAFAAYFSGFFLQLLAVVLLDSLAGALVGTVIHYCSTMVIEEKYGFNRSTLKTFVTDRIRTFLLEFTINMAPFGSFIQVWSETHSLQKI